MKSLHCTGLKGPVRRSPAPAGTYRRPNTFTFTPVHRLGLSTCHRRRVTGRISMVSNQRPTSPERKPERSESDGPWQFACPNGHRNLYYYESDSGAYCHGCNQSYPEEKLVDLTEQRARLPPKGGVDRAE